jgi:IS30 family transposase
LSKVDRDEISILKKKGYSLRDIAKELGRSVSTISDELKRNKVKGQYDPKKAAHKAYVRRKGAKYQSMKIVSHTALRDRVETLLLEHRSPESIAGRISNKERDLPPISGDSIERFLKSVYGRKIEAKRQQQKAKRKWRKKRLKVTQLADRKFIDTRPSIINQRGRVGDAESDFILSGRDGAGILLTAADRKLRVSFIEQILKVTITEVEQACVRIKKRYPEWCTMTTDNDLLWQHHLRLEKLLDITIYFCHPYHSWEKGTIENTNGEVRKDIPKGSDISQYSLHDMQKIEKRLNDRFMECLRFATPQEALDLYRKKMKNKKSPKGKCSD